MLDSISFPKSISEYFSVGPTDMVRSWMNSSAESILSFEICENQYFELFVSLSALKSEMGEDTFGAVSRLSLSDTTSGGVTVAMQ